MRLLTLAIVALSASAGLSSAQATRANAPPGEHRGYIEGDVYLALRSGQVSKIAASTVRLVAADSAMAANGECADSAKDRSSDYRVQDQLSAAFMKHLVAGTVRSSPTGMEAHYRIDSIPAGRYVLWAEARLSIPYHWLVPITVDSVGRQKVDLDNSNVSLGTMYCLVTR